jgi:hypothetical protein
MCNQAGFRVFTMLRLLALFLLPMSAKAQLSDTLLCRNQKLWTHQGIWMETMPHGCYGQEYQDITDNMVPAAQRAWQRALEQLKARSGSLMVSKFTLKEVRQLTQPCKEATYIFKLSMDAAPGWPYRITLVTDAKGKILTPEAIPLPKGNVSADFVEPCVAVEVAIGQKGVGKELTYIRPAYSPEFNTLVWEVYGIGMMPGDIPVYVYDAHRETPSRVHQVALVEGATGKVLDVVYIANLEILLPDPGAVHPIVKRVEKDRKENKQK